MADHTKGIAEQIVEAAERLRGRVGCGPHWPLILAVPAPLDTNLTVLLNYAGISVVVDKYIAPGNWYLRDGVKR